MQHNGQKFKYTVEWDKFNDHWVVNKYGKEVKAFSEDNKAGAEKYCQECIEDERHPNY